MIIITGASKGIGRAISLRLLEQGHEIFGLSRNFGCSDFDGHSCDVSDYQDVRKVVKLIKKNKRDVDVLINAAGIASMNLLVTSPPTATSKIINTNLVGTINCCQLFAPLMMRKKKGSIINFSTIAVPLALKGEAIYVASKAGVEGFTRAFSREMADFNIRVNCIAPGPINTDLIKGITDKQISEIIQRQILNRQFDLDDVCDLVDLLLDKKSSSLSGQILNIGGV